MPPPLLEVLLRPWIASTIIVGFALGYAIGFSGRGRPVLVSRSQFLMLGIEPAVALTSKIGSIIWWFLAGGLGLVFSDQHRAWSISRVAN
jgi:hypothetical protein